MQTSTLTETRQNGNLRTSPAAAMVIGGGIGGMRAALDLADAGLKVYLIEQTPCLGGRVAQLGYMFPQHDCVLCRGDMDALDRLFRRLISSRTNIPILKYLPTHT
jgi:heterodisulfide reductase subunit A-like polyferredoxin